MKFLTGVKKTCHNEHTGVLAGAGFSVSLATDSVRLGNAFGNNRAQNGQNSSLEGCIPVQAAMVFPVEGTSFRVANQHNKTYHRTDEPCQDGSVFLLDPHNAYSVCRSYCNDITFHDGNHYSLEFGGHR